MQHLLPTRIATLIACALLPLLQGPDQEAEERKFTHWQHVRVDWFRGRGTEVPRDCRGCHDYSRGEPRDPQEVCLDCHRTNVASGTATLTIPHQALERWRNLTRSRDHSRTFAHRDHNKLECRHCHQPVSGGGGLGTSDELRRLAGTGSCVRCHDPAEQSRAVQSAGKPEQVAAFVARLNERLQGKPETSFDHRQHLTRAVAMGTEAPRIDVCTPCHQPLGATPARLIGLAGIDQQACATCHRTKDAATKVDFGFTDTQVASPTRLSFVHQPHLTAEALTQGELTEGCLACHERRLAPDGLHWPLARVWTTPNTSTYGQCDNCHSKRTKATTVTIDHRGNFADQCAACHVVGARQGVLKEQRPTSVVKRPKLGLRFQITSQAHPFITGLKIERACSDCHRAKIPRLPSRLATRSFSHATHLPAEPVDADCKRCHPGLEAAASAADLVPYDPRACKGCHLGEEAPDPFVPQKPEQRSVPRFPHARHLSKDALRHPRLKERSCLACHGSGDGKWKAEVGYQADIAKCTPCHNHKDEAAVRITGGRNQKYVETCKSCHGDALPDPKSGAAEQNAHVVVTRATPAPHHPLPSEQPCKTCHVAAWTFFKNELGDPTAVERLTGVHKQPESKYSEAGDCARCHWSDALLDPKRRGEGVTREQLFEQFSKVTGYGVKK